MIATLLGSILAGYIVGGDLQRQDRIDAAKNHHRPADDLIAGASRAGSQLQQQIPAPQDSHSGNNQADDWIPGLTPETWPQWGLLIVGIAGACFAIKTLRAIQHQAETAANDMQLRFTQWIAIGDMQGDCGTLRIPVPGKDDAFYYPFTVSFRINNPTAYPITVSRTVSQAGLWRGESLGGGVINPGAPGHFVRDEIETQVPLAEHAPRRVGYTHRVSVEYVNALGWTVKQDAEWHVSGDVDLGSVEFSNVNYRPPEVLMRPG